MVVPHAAPLEGGSCANREGKEGRPTNVDRDPLLPGKDGSAKVLPARQVPCTDFINAFVASELEGPCMDILGVRDSPDNRRTMNANEMAKRISRESNP